MTEWLEEVLKSKTPKIQTLESLGTAKILKIFSKVKDKQILGGRAEKGKITLGAQVKIMRRDAEIGTGKIKELQQLKSKAKDGRGGPNRNNVNRKGSWANRTLRRPSNSRNTIFIK